MPVEFRAYLEQTLVEGFFHADPHPGNVFVTEDGRLALLDLGQVARISPALRDRLLKLVVSIAEGNGDEATDLVTRIGQMRVEPRGCAENGLKLRVDAIDEDLLVDGFQKVANRIALGLVLAALIVGAALLMQVPTSFRILGYPGSAAPQPPLSAVEPPGLAILFFLFAVAGGVALAAQIVLGDRKVHARERRPGR